MFINIFFSLFEERIYNINLGELGTWVKLGLDNLSTRKKKFIIGELSGEDFWHNSHELMEDGTKFTKDNPASLFSIFSFYDSELSSERRFILFYLGLDLRLNFCS